MSDKEIKNNGPSNSPGIVGQIKRLKSDSGASLDELRQFVRDLRGRTPQEVIGILSKSDLLRATTIAAAATVVLMLLFTIVPAMTTPEAPPVAVKTAPVEAPTPVAAKDGTAAPAKDAKVGKDALDKLKVNETKTVDPKTKNPLDDITDDLFKGIK